MHRARTLLSAVSVPAVAWMAHAIARGSAAPIAHAESGAAPAAKPAETPAAHPYPVVLTSTGGAEDSVRAAVPGEYHEVDVKGRFGRLDHHLIYSSLWGPKRVQTYRTFIDAPGRNLRTAIEFGSEVCGHKGIVHGGMLAAALDDSFGALFLSAGVGSGFTANLTIDYRKPVKPDELYLVKAHIDDIDGRKVFIHGSIVHVETGHVCTEARALFIVARDQAALLRPKHQPQDSPLDS